MSYFCLQGYCCQFKSVEDDDVQEYQQQQAEETGEEFDSQLEWLSDELLEDNLKGAPGSDKGVSPSSPASTLPHLEFLIGGTLPSTSFVRLEEGLHQMLDVVTAMLDQALSDQGSQGSRKSTWTTTLARAVTPKKRWEKEEDKAGNILFYYPEFFDLLLDS